MDGWALFVVAIVLIGLIQLFAFYRARDSWEASPETGLDGELLATHDPAERAPDADVGDDGKQVCQRCGTINEVGYTYCRECLSYLHGPSQHHRA